jgi:glycosyltransferase involved in cell wall biosynthesis
MSGRLRIGVDARPLAAPRTGIGRYLQSLLSRMIAISSADKRAAIQWYLYSDRPIDDDFAATENIVVRDYPAGAGKILMLWRTQIGFSLRARQDELDVFWSPRHHLPLLLGRRVRKILTIHDLVWKYYPQTMQRSGLWLERILMPLSIRLADHILTDAYATRSDLSREYPGAAKISVIQCGCEHWQAQAAVVKEPYFLFVGTWQPRKNIGGILKAFRLLLDDRQLPHRLVIAGSEGWHTDVGHMVAELALHDRVLLQGEVSDQELHALYQHAFALLCPSFYEGFGLPALEAMQYGVPVIGSDRSSLPEVIGAGGVLVNPYDPMAIRDAMRSLIFCPQQREHLSRLARQQAGNFSWDTAAEMTLAILTSFQFK